ncbi:long-chain-fatty-acid--CoA ligase, putative [Entamoeba histolytica HM-1:IMSS-B]|uniref:Long-chain-fatty-acid--CoA ligase, putative n=6 Tax=Entamoeba histolytica TaxID=5759 RepID=C4M7S1_ENTH1|nr:long-chain-fatty-acid--CoA ligase, putative [Entamoeba histolytica HM-1:IMSS]EMD46257.1 longchain-fatty-acid-CoA ligase, putative [Entamoeba histolytica KU27]EMH77759.1 long-chain-fatty-acid--CoA ligase, putative [Entamoeba histolytica HM-1:IMSS-B]EMS13936.1 long-chain-fatty-acid--CoA ligase, putative [Entamoeba histolytica HM-3:IMSS]ENY61520.1 long-chain-fatty-acid--CoA ligase, putative [Entamoeba histolytica HM-1:IMSS-A]GAT97603.1 long-chain-fatty-acid--coa ligase putative [Entamoeba hist|eukprot:XP_651087.1 long-chain-fatty-acid--CoA ligase, putative [Entamoeba histolytica HM-1:IMSS]
MKKQSYDSTFTKKEGNKFYFLNQTEHWSAGEKDDIEYMTQHTTYEVIKRRCEKNPENDFFGYRKREGKKYIGEYIWLKNKEVLEMTDSLASGIMNKYHLKKGDSCGIISGNRYEWYLTQFALQRHGIIPVPLYTTLGKEAIDYIISTLSITLVFCTFSDTVAEMCERNPKITLVCFDTFEDIMNHINPSISYVTFDRLIKEGKSNLIEPQLPTMDDTFSIIFTSGTSGIPKGAVHSFNSASYGSCTINSAELFKDSPMKEQTYFSYLPSAHVLDQEVTHGFIYGGGRIGFISGGIPTLIEDLSKCQPTFFIAVPRVLQKIYDKFNETYNQLGYFSQTLFNIGYYYKLNAVKNKSWNYINWDNIVFYKIHQVFGGKLKYILNGGAPLTEELYEWLRVCSGAIILQGYGLTETFGGICCSLPYMTDLNILNVGSCGPNVEIRLVSVPEMNYTIDDEYPSGEIEIRSKQNFICYYKNEEATKAAINDDGFFATGDIGKVCPDGSLAIIDRKKNLFKLAQGEYIAVEPLENKYCAMPLISQCFIYGESSDVFITAIIVLDFDELKRIASSITTESEKDSLLNIHYLNKIDIKKKILQIIQNYIKTQHVPGYEIIKNVYFETEHFSTENDLMTPSFKLKRPQLKRKYLTILKQLRTEIQNNLI